MTEPEQQQAAGTAIAAFTLVQIVLWKMIQNGTITKSEAVRLLKQGIEANRPGGPANQYALQKLSLVLDMIEKDAALKN